MKKDPLVSIVIPVYNRSKTIRRAILSVSNQAYKNIELIIVDDASTDNTPKIIKNYINKNKTLTITYLRVKKNMGVVSARAEGIKRAKGEYIAFLDSDDELTPNSISDRISVSLNSKDINTVIYGDIIMNGEIRKFVQKKGYIYPYLLKELSICPPNAILIRKICFNKSGHPDKGMETWEDDDRMLKLAKYFPVAHTKAIVARQYTSSDSASIDQTRNLLGLKNMLLKYGNEILEHHGYFRLFLWKIRILRLKLLELKSRYVTQNQTIGIFLIRCTMFILDKILYIWFDNLFV